MEEIQLQDAVTVNFDGDKATMIPGWYITPPDFDPWQQKYPLILNDVDNFILLLSPINYLASV